MIEIISERPPFSDEKLKKPKELKGIKPVFSLKWGGVTSCQVFINGDDVWINHHDWCSKTFYGAGAEYKQHFVYSDGFTAPTKKGNAWIVMRGLTRVRAVDAIRRISSEAEKAINPNSRFCRDDVRMFEDIVLKLCGMNVMTNSKL